MNYGAQRKDTREVKDAVDDFEKESGEELSDKAEELLAKGDEKVPKFPFFILSIALLKDIIDMLDFTIVGIIIVEIAMLPLSVILFLWLFNKIHGGWWKKGLIKWLWNRYILTMIVEFIPGFQLVPATTIFVLMAHHKESKAVKMFNRMLEKLRAVAEGDRDDTTVLRAGYEAYTEENQVDGVVPPSAANDNKNTRGDRERNQNTRPTQNTSPEYNSSKNNGGRNGKENLKDVTSSRSMEHGTRKADTRTPNTAHHAKKNDENKNNQDASQESHPENTNVAPFPRDISTQEIPEEAFTENNENPEEELVMEEGAESSVLENEALDQDQDFFDTTERIN